MERTSLEMVRAKLMDFDLVGTEENARMASVEKRHSILKAKSKID